MCECVAGQSGSVCKHQVIAAQYSIQPLPQQFTASSEERRLLAFVALGGVEVHADFFKEVTDMPGSHTSQTLNLATTTHDLTAPTTAEPSVSQVDLPTEEDLEDFEIPTSKSLSEDEIDNFLNKLRQVLKTFGDAETTPSAIRKAEKRLSKVTTTSQLDSMLHTMGSGVVARIGGRAKIPCTPASIARRQEGMPRGRATVGRGKRPNVLPAKQRKRKRNLCLAVSNNHANGYSH